MSNLIFHKCHQWSDDYADSFHCKCRHLKCYRLTSTCGHESKSVMSTGYGLNYITLYSAKRVISPILF